MEQVITISAAELRKLIRHEIDDALSAYAGSDMLTLVDAAKYLGVSESLLYKLSSPANPEIPCEGNPKRFKKSDLDNYRLRRKRKSLDEIQVMAETIVSVKGNRVTRVGKRKS
jgi:hypothetical protein